MLLIDGVKYQEWMPQGPRAEDEFERVVKEHTEEIFGEQSIYLDRKQKLKSLSGVGSIPDGYVIIYGGSFEWHIVEVELSSHPLHDHIISQVGRFISGISNPNIQRGIVNAIDEEIARDNFLKLRLRKAIEPTEIYRFLSDLISKQPVLTIIIEKDTEELREALNTLRYPQIKVVEFQTFTREGTGLVVHAHLFEPLYKGVDLKAISMPNMKEEDFESLFIFMGVENFWIKYKRLRIRSEYLKDLWLSLDTNFDLETDIGIIKTKIDKWNQICVGMGKWYKAHPELKAGDLVTFKVLEPMKRYRLEIERRGKEAV